jgi:hypothetical protein
VQHDRDRRLVDKQQQLRPQQQPPRAKEPRAAVPRMKLLPLSVAVAFALASRAKGDACSDLCETAKVVCETACAADIFDEPECGYACRALDVTCDAACSSPTAAPTDPPTAPRTASPTQQPTTYPTHSDDWYSSYEPIEATAGHQDASSKAGPTPASESKQGPSLRGNKHRNGRKRELSSLELKAGVASIVKKALCGLGNHDQNRAALLCAKLGELSSASL